MVARAPFTDADVDRLIAWISSPQLLSQWAASGFSYPLTQAQMEAHMRTSAEPRARRPRSGLDTPTFSGAQFDPELG
jgi:hypothetical protein